MTVAHVRPRRGADAVDVMFLDSARVYKLPRAHPAFERIVRRLREAMAAGRPVKVRLASLDSDVIEDVPEP